MSRRHEVAIGVMAGAAFACFAQWHVEEAMALVLAAGITYLHKAIVDIRELEQLAEQRNAQREKLARAQDYLQGRSPLTGHPPYVLVKRAPPESDDLVPQETREAVRRLLERAKGGAL